MYCQFVMFRYSTCQVSSLMLIPSIALAPLALSPGSLALSHWNCGGRDTKRESFVHIVCACANFTQIGVIHKL